MPPEEDDISHDVLFEEGTMVIDWEEEGEDDG